MNKQKFAILGISVALLVTACKKNDTLAPASASQQTTATASAAAATSSFVNAASWSSAKQEKFTTYSFQVSDSSLSSAVINKGMVLVFQKTATGTNALPYDDKSTNVFWYYQASQGSIVISADVYGTAQQPTGQSFAHFVVTESQLTDLKAKGYSKAQLMNLNYENAVALFKK